MTRAARATLVASLTLAALAPMRAVAGDAIDDPKLARRLGTRVSAPAASPDVTPAPVVPLGAAPASDVVTPSDAARPPGARTADLTAVGGATASGAPAAESAGGRTPVVGLSYRRFTFVQLGATDPGSVTGTASSEPFNSVALDFYPISRTLRFGLSTQYGWQSGGFNSRGGDYFIAQSASLGVQAPGKVATPFAEAFAGGGYLRRFQFDRTIPTAYWQFGIDAGVNLFVAEHGYFSVALGYLRPVNGFLKMQSFTSIYVDTWSLKVGFGI